MAITTKLCSPYRVRSVSTYFQCHRHLQHEYRRYLRANLVIFAVRIISNIVGYYGSGGTYPYQAYGVGDGTWSNGTDQAMTFLSGYPHDSYSMDGSVFELIRVSFF